MRAALAVCVLTGLGLLVLAVLPAPNAPEPSRTFDLRTTPVAAATGRPGAAAAVAAPVSAPTRVRIPALGVDAPLSREAVSGDGELVVPGDPGRVGWWHGDASAGGTIPPHGTLVLAGHVDSNGDLGALHALARIGAGQQVRTDDAAGHGQTWRVDALEVHHKDDLPPLPDTGPRRLAIVTCGGPVVETRHGRRYRDNVIAWATPVP